MPEDNRILLVPRLFFEMEDMQLRAHENNLSLVIYPKDFYMDPSKSERVVAIMLGDDWFGGEQMDEFPNLRTITRNGTGYDNIDISEANRRRIIVSRITKLAAEVVSEYAVGLLLALSRKIFLAHYSFSYKDSWDDRKHFQGKMLRDMTVGVVGLGSIGRKFVEKISRMNPKRVIAWNRTMRDTVKDTAERYGVTLCSFEEVVRESDALIVTLALRPETKHIINQVMLDEMKQGSFLVNVGRGALIDEEALTLHIEQGKFGGVALDVFSEEPPFNKHFFNYLQGVVRNGGNVILTPHHATIAERIVKDAAHIGMDNTLKILSGDTDGIEIVTA